MIAISFGVPIWGLLIEILRCSELQRWMKTLVMWIKFFYTYSTEVKWVSIFEDMGNEGIWRKIYFDEEIFPHIFEQSNSTGLRWKKWVNVWMSLQGQLEFHTQWREKGLAGARWPSNNEVAAHQQLFEQARTKVSITPRVYLQDVLEVCCADYSTRSSPLLRLLVLRSSFQKSPLRLFSFCTF